MGKYLLAMLASGSLYSLESIPSNNTPNTILGVRVDSTPPKRLYRCLFKATIRSHSF
ncbi:hypothetical protein [Chryseobacterium aurantiacum]|uniref:hypothetical protein n=1 Tax=Chryseobacterium aurantiacum TaxID=2116499 RepID=UPI0013C51A65|nr:hypothetical protein [Chryseobacterium aurantiacum]